MPLQQLHSSLTSCSPVSFHCVKAKSPYLEMGDSAENNPPCILATSQVSQGWWWLALNSEWQPIWQSDHLLELEWAWPPYPEARKRRVSGNELHFSLSSHQLQLLLSPQGGMEDTWVIGRKDSQHQHTPQTSLQGGLSPWQILVLQQEIGS